MDVRIENSFETLSQEEWERYLEIDLFENMRLSCATFGISEVFFENISHPKMPELIKEHNNKIGSLQITYALCRHYFEQGIPDDPWYASSGPEGQAIKYMPNFHEEHWMRKYWFNYFADTYYLKLMAVWDSIIEIINHFYSYDFIIDLRLRNNVLKKLKSDNPALHLIFTELQTDPIYVDAQKYRTAAAHGTSAGEISNTVSIDRDVETEVPVLDESGKLIMKKIKASAVVSLGIGEYTMTKDIDANMEQFATLTGNKIQEIAACMTAAT